ncbi:MAG TPA: hypothetical protein VF268_09395 [Gammaproteobacteria bacterium]|jgi:hypothetical protein
MMRALLFAVVALLGTACIPSNHAIGSGNEANSQTVRIIVGFSRPGFDYDQPAFLQTLSGELAAEVTFLRPLSGNAAMYLCQTTGPIDVFLARLKNLSAHSDIEYVEPDQKRTKLN